MITVEHLTKRYGEFTAVSDLSFEIEEEHVYGFLECERCGKIHDNEHNDRVSVRHGGACQN